MEEHSPLEIQNNNTENSSEVHHCKNCENEFSGHYCNHCGQKWEYNELSVKGLISTFYQYRLKDIRVFIQTTWWLITQPGTVVKEYREGKKLRYYNPFNYFLLIASITLFVTLQFSPLDAKKALSNQLKMYGVPTAEEIEEKIANENLSEEESRVLRQQNKISQSQIKTMTWFQQHFNLMMILLVPVFTLAIHLNFKKMGISYSEHLLMTLHIYGFSTLLNVPLLVFSDPFDVTSKVKILSLPIFLIYFTWAFRDIYKISWGKGVWKSILVYLTNFALVFTLVLGVLIVMLIGILLFIAAKKLPLPISLAVGTSLIGVIGFLIYNRIRKRRKAPIIESVS